MEQTPSRDGTLPCLLLHPCKQVSWGSTGLLNLSACFDFKYFWKSRVYLFGIGPDGEVNLETEFQIPSRSKLLWVSGQGRVAGFVFRTGSESPVVSIVHLDHPSVTLEIRLPSDCGETSNGSTSPAEPESTSSIEKMELFLRAEGSWKICFPRPDLAVICGRDRLLAYNIPPFSTLLRGQNSMNAEPTWRLPSPIVARGHKTSAEVFYDPSLPDRRFNIHFSHQLDDLDYTTYYVGLTTLKIDPSNPPLSSSGAPAYQRIESRFPTDGPTVKWGSLYSEIYHSRSLLHSEGLDVWITSLEDTSFAQANGEGNGRGPLFVFISNDDLEPDLEWESVDLDEASGRIFIWGPAFRWMTPSETRIFVGELVS